MFFDRPMLLRPRTLPGMPASSQVLAVPFADLVAAGLAMRAVELAKRQHALRLVIAVCAGCTPCERFGTILAAAAHRNEIRVTMLYPGLHGEGHAADRPANPYLTAADGTGWPERFTLADLEPVAGSYADAVRASRHRAGQLDDAVDGNASGPAGNHGQYATAVHLVDALSTLPSPPATIWMPHDPATWAALDAALRLLGWPTVIAAVADASSHPVPRPVSALEPYLGPRAATDRAAALHPARRAEARATLADAGMPSNHHAYADGLAGLLTEHRDDQTVRGDLALVPLPSLALMHRRAAWPGSTAHRPEGEA